MNHRLAGGPLKPSFGLSGGSSDFNNRLQPAQIYADNLSTVLLNKSYNYTLNTPGNNGNIMQITDGRDSNRTVSFGYDNLNRVTTALSAGTDCTVGGGITRNWGQSFTYDPWGNLKNVAATRCSAPTFSATVLANNQLSGYSYDAAGNMTQNGTAAYAYNAEGQMSSALGVTYTYDAAGQRIARNGSGIVDTQYLYGPGGEVLAETDGGGTLLREYVYFGGKRVARRDVSTGTVHYYLSDQLGSADVVASAAGTIEEESEFYPFGGERIYTDTLPDQAYKFTGKERDTESNLDYFGARYYASTMGRWMTPDWAATATAVPYADFGDPQTLNLYGYTRNNPLSHADSDGHCPWCVGAAIGALVGAAVEGYSQYKSGKFNMAKLTGKTLQGAVVGAVAVATAGASLAYQATAVASAQVVTGVAARATDNDKKTAALDQKEVLKDTATGAAAGAAGALASKAVQGTVQKVGGKFADAVTTSITPGAKGANQLGVEATINGGKVVAGAARGAARVGTAAVVDKVKDKKP